MSYLTRTGDVRDLVRRYGADPYGVRDIGPALNDAIADRSRGGDIIQLPPGTFKLSSEVYGAAPGSSLIIRGAGPSTKIYPQLNSYEDGITINNTPGGGVCGLENLSFIGPQVLDPGASLSTPQCYRAVVLGGTFGAPVLRRVGFYGVYAKGSVAYLGNGAIDGLVEGCDWEGCVAFGDTGVDPQSLLECNIIFGVTVRNSRFLSTGYFAEQQLTGGACRQAIRLRHYDVSEGPYAASQARIANCFFYTPGTTSISTLEPDGNPNGPTSPIFYTGTSRAYGFKTPPGVGTWGRPTGTPTGGYQQQYTFQIRIDTTGVTGVAQWSTRFENAGFGGGYTAWVSQGAVSNATVNGITFTMTPAQTFTSGHTYQCYVTSQARMRQVIVEKCSMYGNGGLSTFGILASQIDRLVVEDLDFDASSQSYAIDMYDVDEAIITTPQIRGHKIRAEAAGFGFGACNLVVVKDHNADAVLDLSLASQVVVDGGGRRNLPSYAYGSMPGAATTPTGSLAYNREDARVSVFNGADWLPVAGAVHIKGVSTGYTVGPMDRLLVLSATGATIPITLPSGPTGAILTIKDIVGAVGASYPVHVRGPSGYTIDGATAGIVINTAFGSRSIGFLGGNAFITLDGAAVGAGATGAAGPTGAAGVTGATGPQGAQGAQGSPGGSYEERFTVYFTDASNATGYTFYDILLATALASGYLILLSAGPTDPAFGPVFPAYVSKTPTSFRIINSVPFMGEISANAKVR